MDSVANEFRFEVTWLPFLLRPDTPLEGKAKPANTPDNPRVGARMKQMGDAEGVNFTGLCDFVPNTIRAHILTEAAAEKGKSDEIATRLLLAYFTDGQDVSNVDNLVEWGSEIAGLDKDKLRAKLEDEDLWSKTRVEIIKQQRSLGVNGVPFFFINGQHAFSGAQDAAGFVQAFRRYAGN